jgi:hypothetical protein
MQVLILLFAKQLFASRILWALVGCLCSNVLLSSCASPSSEQKIEVNVSQTWQLQPGDRIAGHAVTGGLGDISIELATDGWALLMGGRAVYAPFPGEIRMDARQCLFYTSGEVPAYMFRLCGLSPAQLGNVRAGQPIGRGKMLQFATLRQQPDGKWAIVEPDKTFIEKLLKAP